jgi:hypothetical protein
MAFNMRHGPTRSASKRDRSSMLHGAIIALGSKFKCSKTLVNQLFLLSATDSCKKKSSVEKIEEGSGSGLL